MTHIVDESATPNMDMFPIDGVLEQPHDVLSDRVLCCKPLCPSEKLAGVYGSLFDGEATHREPLVSHDRLRGTPPDPPESEPKMQRLVRQAVRANLRQERVDRVRNVI